jgi:hypothetical protein
MFYPVYISLCNSLKKVLSTGNQFSSGLVSQTMRTLFLLVMSFLIHFSPLIARNPIEEGFISNGDVDGDGYFDLFDLIRLERTVALNMSVTADELESADVDGDGQLTSFDLLVMNDALKKVNAGMDMFDAVKTAIEDDLGKTGDNVEIYLDLARFYRKEGILSRSKSVLESIVEALDLRHPLYQTIVTTLDKIKAEEFDTITQDEDYLSQDIYQTSGDITGKIGLRRKVVQLKSRLSKLLKDKSFAAHYDSKRIKSRLGGVMDDMLRSISKDKMVDPESFTNFNNEIRRVLEDPDNLVKPLDNEHRVKLQQIVNQSTAGMREEAIKIRQENLAHQQAANQSFRSPAAPGTGPTGEILDRRDWRRDATSRRENMAMDRLILTNPPLLEPDTISLVAPAYTLKWDVSNVLGAKNAALEISKANLKFTNPRGEVPDQNNTLYYTPALGGIDGVRKGSAMELEGVGTYYYRVAALNAKGEFISRFSDSTPLIVVYNNVDIIASKPELEPRHVNPDDPDYTFRWDISNVEGAKDVAVEISRPNLTFDNPNGRKRDRSNSWFFNHSLGKLMGTQSSNIDGLPGPGNYLFRVIGVSPYGDFIGRWSDPETLIVHAGEILPEEVTPPEEPFIPEAPQIETTDSDFSVSWDVSSITDARGVNLEVASVAPGDSLNADDIREFSPDQIVYKDSIEGTKGALKISPTQLPGPGDYILHISAVDSVGNLISSWSKPSRLVLNEASITKSQALPPAEKASGPSQIEQTEAAQPSPEGESLEVIRNNTPLYEQNSPSSSEIATLQKGEKLVRVSTNGLWYRVFYPVGGKYGWVLNFNVKSSE